MLGFKKFILLLNFMNRMHCRRRSKEEIYRDVLNCLKQGPKKVSHIMCSANLSSYSFGVYLPLLENNGLVEMLYEERSKKCKITSKGREFLEKFNRAEDTALF